MAENKEKNRKSTPESLNESKRKSTYAEMTKKTNQGSFSEEDRTKLTLIYENVASLRDEMKELREELEGSKLEIKQLKTENNQLKQALNLNTFETDNLQQYSRRENIRIHGIAESASQKDDGESTLLKLAEVLGITLESSNIQRAHRLGKKRSSAAKPRPIIARFVSYKKEANFFLQSPALGKALTKSLKLRLLLKISPHCGQNC